MAAHYALATTEFGEVIRSSPNDPLAGNSFYYLGEIDYRAGKYATAIKDYDHVLEQFPNNAKGAISHLHKARPSSRQANARLASVNCAPSSPASPTPRKLSRPAANSTAWASPSSPSAQTSSSNPHSTCNATAQRLSW